MPVRKRNLKRRGDLTADEQAWLNGEYHSGFVQFMPREKLEALWEHYGDHENFVWHRRMSRPERISN
jgi:hypothetical protein